MTAKAVIVVVQAVDFLAAETVLPPAAVIREFLAMTVKAIRIDFF